MKNIQYDSTYKPGMYIKTTVTKAQLQSIIKTLLFAELLPSTDSDIKFSV